MRISDWSSDVCSSDLEDAMTDLDQFRADTRTWLEANCPPEMRKPVRAESDVCWGGRDQSKLTPAQKQWMDAMGARGWTVRSEEHTSELQSLMRNSYAVFCLKKKQTKMTKSLDTKNTS